MSKIYSIGISNGDATVRAMNLYSNYGLLHEGQILINCWNTEQSVDILVGLGNLSFLGQDLNTTISCARDEKMDWALVAPNEFKNHRHWKGYAKLLKCNGFFLFNTASGRWTAYNRAGIMVQDLYEYLVGEDDV